MSAKLTSLLAAVALAGGLATAHGVFAEETRPAPARPDPSQPSQSMMGGGMMDMMAQMNRMMAGCNKMMEGMNQAPNAPPAPQAPAPRG